MRHPDSVIIDDDGDAFHLPRVNRPKSRRRACAPISTLVPVEQHLTIRPCVCESRPYGLEITCLEHAQQQGEAQ